MSNSVCRCILGVGHFVWRLCRLCPIQCVGLYCAEVSIWGEGCNGEK